MNFGSYDNNAGNQYFTQDRQQYFGYGRIDAALTQKIRVFGSWLYQYARETGDEIPTSDPISTEPSFLNTAILSPLALYSHGLGWSAPNATYNMGADITLNQHLVATTRYGYFFDNYHDFGWPTSLPDIVWANDGTGACDNSGSTAYPVQCPIADGGGAPLPANLQQPGGTATQPYNASYTLVNCRQALPVQPGLRLLQGRLVGHAQLQVRLPAQPPGELIDQNGNVPYAFMDAWDRRWVAALTTTGDGQLRRSDN